MTKRVLFFRPTLGDGGADRVTLTLLQHLDRSRFAPNLALVRREGVLADDIPADVPVIDLGVRRLALAVPALARAIRRVEPDVVVCTAGGANVIASAAHALARSHARLVLSERSALHRADRPSLTARLEHGLKRLLYARADLVTAVSEGVASDLVSVLAVEPERVRVVYNPVVSSDAGAAADEPIAHPWFAEQVPVIVAVGRLVTVKDYPTMLDAFARIRRERDARLFVLGEGPLRGELEAAARSLGLADAVAFAGYDKNPHRYMKRAAIVLQSSLAEGLPGTLIQSMAAGTPVVATDCDHGPREVVRDGVDGYLVRVGDAGALAARSLEILRDRDLRARLGKSAAERAWRFSVLAAMARYEEALGA